MSPSSHRRPARPTLRQRAGRLRLHQGLLVAGTVVAGAAAILSPHPARAAANQTWAPFVLVAGLLMVGAVAHADGLFDVIGTKVSLIGTRPSVLLVALLGIVAAVTVVLNLDTAVAFLTPVLLLAARARGADEEPFLYGTLFMANAASLVLPGSNLTNLLVLAHEHVAGSAYALRMLPASLPPIVVVAVFAVVAHRHRLADPASGGDVAPTTHRRWSSSVAAIAVAAILVLVLHAPALPVLVVGAVLAASAVARRAVSAREVWDAVEPAALVGLFGLAIGLGTLARSWGAPAHLVARANGPETAVLGALTAVAVNNLPAAVLLSARGVMHPRALLIGLDLGPNLAVTGSLSSLIWYRAARTVGATPSARRVTTLGIVLTPLTITAALLALKLLAPARL